MVLIYNLKAVLRQIPPLFWFLVRNTILNSRQDTCFPRTLACADCKRSEQRRMTDY
jgi:hypothetical protein